MKRVSTIIFFLVSVLLVSSCVTTSGELAPVTTGRTLAPVATRCGIGGERTVAKTEPYLGL